MSHLKIGQKRESSQHLKYKSTYILTAFVWHWALLCHSAWANLQCPGTRSNGQTPPALQWCPEGTKLAIREPVFVAKVFVSLHFILPAAASQIFENSPTRGALSRRPHPFCLFAFSWCANGAQFCCQAVCTRGCHLSRGRERGPHVSAYWSRVPRAPRITLGAHLINGQVGKRAPEPITRRALENNAGRGRARRVLNSGRN